MTDPRAPDPGQSGGEPGGDYGPPSGYVPPPPYAPPGYPTGPPGYPTQPGYGPPYPPPGYGYPVYALPPGYVAVPAYYPRPEEPPAPLAFGVLAAALAGLGALLLIVSLVGMPWFSGVGSELTTCGGSDFTTGDVRCVLDNYGDAASGLSVAFFSWLAWLLLALSAGSAVAAALPFRGLSLAFRITAPIVAGFAVLLSFGAIELTSSVYATGDTYSRFFDRLSYGFWFAVVGYAFIGAGGIVGPRTAHS